MRDYSYTARSVRPVSPAFDLHSPAFTLHLSTARLPPYPLPERRPHRGQLPDVGDIPIPSISEGGGLREVFRRVLLRIARRRSPVAVDLTSGDTGDDLGSAPGRQHIQTVTFGTPEEFGAADVSVTSRARQEARDDVSLV